MVELTISEGLGFTLDTDVGTEPVTGTLADYSVNSDTFILLITDTAAGYGINLNDVPVNGHQLSSASEFIAIFDAHANA